MLIGGVIDDELRQHLDVTRMRGLEERLEIVDRAVRWVDRLVRRDVVAVVLERRWIEWQQPDAGGTELLNVVELLDHTAEVAEAVAIGVAERLDVQLIDDRVLVPERVCHFSTRNT